MRASGSGEGGPGRHQGTPDIELGMVHFILNIPALSLSGNLLILPGSRYRVCMCRVHNNAVQWQCKDEGRSKYPLLVPKLVLICIQIHCWVVGAVGHC